MRAPDWFRIIIFLLQALSLAACAGDPMGLLTLEYQKSIPQEAQMILNSDPQGPIPAPNIPTDLASAARAAAQTEPSSEIRAQPIEYEVICRAPGVPELETEFAESSHLYQMKAEPLYSLAGLEQRLQDSLKQGQDLLHSLGYYEGEVKGRVEVRDGAGPEARVTVEFAAGPRYRIGTTRVYHFAAPTAESRRGALETENQLPATLEEAGLSRGSPAQAEAVLEAVSRVRGHYRDRGYPFAEILEDRYYLVPESRELEAKVWVTPGDFSRMGPAIFRGRFNVKPEYLEELRTWRLGRPWNQRTIERFRDSLKQTGLFQAVDIEPSKEADAEGRRRVVTTLESAPERTVGGALKYDSDFGLGLSAYWEHRNFTGWGDKLRFEMPLWSDLQELTFHYQRPYFYSHYQTLTLQGGLRNQKADAYKLSSAALSAEVSRQLTRRLRGILMASAEGGSLEETDSPRRDYMLFGLPLGLTYDHTNSILDTTRGGRVTFSLIPYTGRYFTDFSVLRTRMDVQAFLPFLEKDRLVLAFRGTWGSLWGASASTVPTSVRFYSGGGGSIRGYDHQSVGPRNSRNEPAGGSALLETSAELRYRFSETIGVVTFLDGGTVFEKAGFNLNRDMRWGAGLGFRYYTAIGPVRLDVATPLNPRDSDSAIQIYISIGQSF